jgi:hypothetical protein
LRANKSLGFKVHPTFHLDGFSSTLSPKKIKNFQSFFDSWEVATKKNMGIYGP